MVCWEGRVVYNNDWTGMLVKAKMVVGVQDGMQE